MEKTGFAAVELVFGPIGVRRNQFCKYRGSAIRDRNRWRRATGFLQFGPALPALSTETKRIFKGDRRNHKFGQTIVYGNE